ncbi:hypothetical protein B0H99_102167 [Planomicrobium soli]|uniref:Uncharacterized protein n=1 Tax=Planomicrobium soli TaxID=1176648 RepID=A0A2P8H5J6_9BACL|nr:hypothetical protein B0H99_102167 [Planomicrobium soli]
MSAHTVFAINLSMLLLSKFAEATGLSGKFLVVHFSNKFEINNPAKIIYIRNRFNCFYDLVTEEVFYSYSNPAFLEPTFNTKYLKTLKRNTHLIQ